MYYSARHAVDRVIVIFERAHEKGGVALGAAPCARTDAGVASHQMRSDGGACASGLMAGTRLMIYQLLSCRCRDLACPSALSARPLGGGREEGSGGQRAAPIRTGWESTMAVHTSRAHGRMVSGRQVHLHPPS